MRKEHKNLNKILIYKKPILKIEITEKKKKNKIPTFYHKHGI